MNFEKYELKTDKYGFKFAKDDVMLGSEESICFMCNRPTKFIEVYSEAHFCSDECVEAFYKIYTKYVSKMNLD